jgi:uncharacterized membrane protein
MIQRIQTVYMLLAVVSMGLLYLPTWAFISVEGDKASMQKAEMSMLEDGLFNTYDHILLMILVGLGALLALVGIFLYANRNLQMRLTRIGMAAGILVVVLTAIFFYQDYQLMDAGQYLIEVEYGVLSPIAFILFSWLALRSISKDEKLVRSMDRLR